MRLRFSDEPAAWIAVISAGISVAIGFGLPWTGEQVSLVNALITLMAGLFVRSQVTPVGHLKEG